MGVEWGSIQLVVTGSLGTSEVRILLFLDLSAGYMDVGKFRKPVNLGIPQNFKLHLS